MVTNNRWWMMGTLVAVGAGAAMIAFRPGTVPAARAASPQREPASASAPAPVSADDLSTAFEKVAEAISPSVVTIRSVRHVQGAPMSEDAFPQFFFRGSPNQENPFRQFQAPGRSRVEQGQGSGVIVSDDGYVLTSSHVVDGADEVTIILTDERSFSARVVGTDPKTDVGVVKIDGSALQAAPLGNSDDLRVGQWVVAAGNPFGLSSTITAGIVSATGRSRVGVADYEDFMQTDAAINPGNSGGPLVNLRGEVVGINTAIFSRNGGNMGIGFAIPINLARSVMQELIDKGRVVRGFLGVVIQGLDEQLAKSFGYEGTDGALVAEVTPGSPAEKAGIVAQDIITRFNGKRVTGPDRFRIEVAAVQPGTSAEVEVFRGGSLRKLDVQVGELPGERASASAPAPETADASLGMTLRTLTPDMARQLGIDESKGGVVVMGVEPASSADRAGLHPQDVIVAVHDQPVANLDEFRTALRQHDLKLGVRLMVRSGATPHYVFLQLRG